MATERSEHEETPVAVTHVEVTTGPLEPGDESAVSVCWQSVDETTALSPEAVRQAAGAAECFLVLGRVSGDQPNASVAGFALLEPAWWYGPGMVSATLIVGRHMWGQGVGRRLWRCVLDETDRRAREGRPENAMFTHIREDHDGAKRFAGQRGFEPTGSRHLPSRLRIAEVDLDNLDEAVARVAEQGIEVHRIETHHLGNDALLRSVYACVVETEHTNPHQEVHSLGFDEWRSRLVDGITSERAPSWFAGSGGRVIGIAYLSVMDGRRLENGFTGVLPGERRRGVGKALKAATIQWALRHGFELMVTSSEASNLPMLAINEGMGYSALPAIEEWSRVFIRGSDGHARTRLPTLCIGSGAVGRFKKLPRCWERDSAAAARPSLQGASVLPSNGARKTANS